MATSLIGALYMNPPVRTADYLASVGEGLGIVKEAHAQVSGSGASVLSPILSLWQVSDKSEFDRHDSDHTSHSLPMTEDSFL